MDGQSKREKEGQKIIGVRKGTSPGFRALLASLWPVQEVDSLPELCSKSQSRKMRSLSPGSLSCHVSAVALGLVKLEGGQCDTNWLCWILVPLALARIIAISHGCPQCPFRRQGTPCPKFACHILVRSPVNSKYTWATTQPSTLRRFSLGGNSPPATRPAFPGPPSRSTFSGLGLWIGHFCGDVSDLCSSSLRSTSLLRWYTISVSGCGKPLHAHEPAVVVFQPRLDAERRSCDGFLFTEGENACTCASPGHGEMQLRLKSRLFRHFSCHCHNPPCMTEPAESLLILRLTSGSQHKHYSCSVPLHCSGRHLRLICPEK